MPFISLFFFFLLVLLFHYENDDIGTSSRPDMLRIDREGVLAPHQSITICTIHPFKLKGTFDIGNRIHAGGSKYKDEEK